MPKFATVAALTLVAGSIPVWRSGERKHLSFWQFLYEHTRFGHTVMYIPEDRYTQALSAEEIRLFQTLYLEKPAPSLKAPLLLDLGESRVDASHTLSAAPSIWMSIPR